MQRVVLNFRVGELERAENIGHLLMDSLVFGTSRIRPLRTLMISHGVRHGSWQGLGS